MSETLLETSEASLLCLPLSLWSPLIPWKSQAFQRWKGSRRSTSTDSSLKTLQQSHGEHTLPRTHRVLSRPRGSACQASTCCFQPGPLGESKLFSHSKSITYPLLPPVLQILNFNWELFQGWRATERWENNSPGWSPLRFLSFQVHFRQDLLFMAGEVRAERKQAWTSYPFRCREPPSRDEGAHRLSESESCGSPPVPQTQVTSTFLPDSSFQVSLCTALWEDLLPAVLGLIMWAPPGFSQTTGFLLCPASFSFNPPPKFGSNNHWDWRDGRFKCTDLVVVLTFKDTDVVTEDAFGYFSKTVNSMFLLVVQR